MSIVDTIVIGGGMSGLSAGYFLKKFGQSVLVLESASRPGGVLQRVVVEGNNLELAANSFLLKQELVSTIEELKLPTIEASSASNSRYLSLETAGGNKLYKAPSSPLEMITTGMISFTAKLRVPFERFVRPITDDLSVHDFLEKRFGSEIAKIGETALNGILAADTSKLSARSALNRFWRLQSEHGSVIGGLFSKKGKKFGVKPRVVTFNGGVTKLAESLAFVMGQDLRLNSEVESIIPGSGVKLSSGEILKAKNFVLASDARSSSRIVQEISPTISQQILSVTYVPLGILYVIGDESDSKTRLNGLGFLKQPKKGNSIIGAIYSSSLFPEETNTKPGQSLLTCFIGGGLTPEVADLRDSKNVERAFEELKLDLGLGSSYRVLHTHFWERAIPFYPIGHYKLKEHLKQLEKERIFVSANWVDRPGLPDCMLRGKEIAERIIR